jgi:hypothetical protein
VADLLTQTDLGLSVLTSIVENAGWPSFPNLFGGSGATGRITLLAPVDDFWESSVNDEDSQRLTTPSWSLHAQDLLRHLILPEEYSRADLQAVIEIPSLAGPPIAFGEIKDPSMKGTNG